MATNPDMLHAGMLPHHPSWREFFSGLRVIVVDERHTDRGVLGSHVANGDPRTWVCVSSSSMGDPRTWVGDRRGWSNNLGRVVVVVVLSSGGCRWVAAYEPGTRARPDAAGDALDKDGVSDLRDAPPIDHCRDGLTDILGTYDSGPLTCKPVTMPPGTGALPITQLWIGADGHRYAATDRRVFEQSNPSSKWTARLG